MTPSGTMARSIQEPSGSTWLILVNWNGREVTLACLASLRQVPSPPFSVLVVDNGSADGSVEAIRSLHPEVHLLSLPENRLFAGGTNTGIRYALDHGATLVVLLNNDTVVDPGFLAPLLAPLRQDRTCGAVAPKMLYHDRPTMLWFAGGAVSFWTGTMKHIGIREEDRGQHDAALPIDYASGCCIATRRDVLERVGMLDEAYSMYTEDADWSLRVRRAGYRILYEPTSRIWHKVSVSAGGNMSWFKLRHKYAGNMRFFFRYATWPQRLVFPWLSILVNALRAIRYIAATRQ